MSWLPAHRAPKDEGRMSMNAMAEVLKRENVQIIDACQDWEDAVHVAVQPLVDQGYVTAGYIDGIISNAEEYGPYFVIAPELALLHARPEQGVIRRQLAVSVVRAGIVFKEGAQPVHLLVTLAATDPDGHIEAMRTLATMFSDPASIRAIIDAKTPDEIYELFTRDI